jgi:hypothetical protein
MRQLIGGRWSKAEDVVRDLLIACGFWLAAVTVLGAGAKLMHLEEAGKFDNLRSNSASLFPAPLWNCWCGFA